MEAPRKYKRKKKVNPCPNPLFIQWLTEWRDEAAEKGIKTQYAYGKALSALKKYPLPFHTGKACKILENFGDKICSMLDKKLELYVATHGNPQAMDTGDVAVPVDEYTEQATQRSNGHNSSTPRKGKRTSEDGINPESDVCKKTQKGSKRAREYIPLYRSGPYAIILTLYNHHKQSGSRGFMNKSELQTQAQQLCDKSFTMPEPGSHYTAWSSMSTLITKGYIHKEGSPARFSITESGCQLAHRLQAVDSQQPSHDALPGLLRASSSSSSLDDDDCVTVNSCQQRNTSERFQSSQSKQDAGDLDYWYIDDRGQRVTSKDKAEVTIDEDDMSVGFLIECPVGALRNSSLRYRPAPDHSAPPGRCKAFLHNDDAAEMCPASLSRTGGRSESYQTDHHPPAKLREDLSQRIPATKMASAPPLSSSSFPSYSSSSSSKTQSNSSSASSKTQSYSQRPHADPVESKTGMHRKDVTAPPLFTLRPGQFDVILCVDNCETAGIGARDGKGRKQVLLKELQKNGVNLDVRKLQVGDFLWVAREKGSALPGQLAMPQRREVVLDYVVERKRMDDLCSSIQDGRFKEQKFRLKQCGLKHPVYLVEEFGSADHMSIPAATLYQSTVNTQVIDGFFVKHTKDTKESAAYFTIMTRYLHSLYSAKTLKAYRREDLDGYDTPDDVTSSVQHCLTFQEFNESSVKNKETTVTETFAKQLLQFSGMTAEKALVLTQLYPTPSHLLDAYATCSLPADQERMLAKLKYGHSQRNMGPVLSKIVCQHYCTPTVLT